MKEWESGPNSQSKHFWCSKCRQQARAHLQLLGCSLLVPSQLGTHFEFLTLDFQNLIGGSLPPKRRYEKLSQTLLLVSVLSLFVKTSLSEEFIVTQIKAWPLTASI